jgi:hypothetical protein
MQTFDMLTSKYPFTLAQVFIYPGHRHYQPKTVPMDQHPWSTTQFMAFF